MATSSNKSILKAEFSRRYPDPLNVAESDTDYNIEHHVLLCRALDIPSGIPKKPNPRQQDVDRGIYKTITASLENHAEPFFHLKNKGITILASRIEYSEDKKVATVFWREDDGIVDGGHTYEIILAAQSRGTCPENQYVKLEILTGVPREMNVEIAEGLNTGMQVQQISLANLKGKFEWIRDTLKGRPYADKISYVENEEGEIDIREVISLMTLFANDLFPAEQGKHPKDAYVSKARCLKLFLDNPDSYKALKPILHDILVLHDLVHINSRKFYNAVKGGSAGAMKGVFEGRKRGKYSFLFTQQENEYRLFDGTLYPILGALRYLVEKKPGQTEYSWKLGSFDKVVELFNKTAAEMVEMTYKTSITYNRKPTAVGKDDNHWVMLYKTIKLAYMEQLEQNH
jgi:hypothetical protein